MTTTIISVAKAKSHISELIVKSQYSHDRFIITKRNKPVAAIVTLDDLHAIEQQEERYGLAQIAGKWPEFEELSASIEDLEKLRAQGGKPREFSL